MRCVRARPSLAVRWRHTNRDRPCEVCSCPYLFQWRSLREPWMREAWGAPSPDKPPKQSESRWGRERGRSIPFSEVTSEASDFRLGGQSGLSASVARTAALDPTRTLAARICCDAQTRHFLQRCGRVQSSDLGEHA